MRHTALLPFILITVLLSAGALGSDRVTATGKVLDSDGNGIDHATVLVYSADVKKGFSIFCPTCYVDCGKRTFTGADGAYRITGLNSDLVFNFLIVREGYSTTFLNRVDPQKGLVETAILKKRNVPENSAQILRGKVVDAKGIPVRDALVEQQGAILGQTQSFGPTGWIDQIASTNEQGEFEIAYKKPLDAAIVLVSPRAMAPTIATLPSGLERTPITVTEGATIRGRLVHNGKPVAQTEVAVVPHSRTMNKKFPEVRIGTGDDGRFAITNIPPRRIWFAYAKMESLAQHGLSAEIIECATNADGQDVNVGDILVKRGYSLRGRVVLIDKKQIPSDMRISLFADRVPDSQTLMLEPDGVFEFKGLTRGVYSLLPSVKGYDVTDARSEELLIEGPVNNFKILLAPALSLKQ